jgi:signal transduction histidine kinase
MLFWLLYLQNRQERILSLIAIGMTMIFLEMFCISVHSFGSKISFTVWNVAKYAADAGFGIIFYIFIYLTAAVFKRPVKASIALLTAVIGLFPLFTIYFSFLQVYYVGLLYQLLIISVFGYLVGSSWKQLKGAQWAVVVGLVAVILFGIVYTFQASKHPFEWPFPYCYELLGGVFLSFPFSLMVYVGMRFKEVLKEVQLNAKEVLSLSEEKKEQAIRQQIVLEQEVARQTIELRTSFENLTSTQAQLIQSEKMASLGELTAGIAHEIQNPLNFVNNFSEVSNELISEMVEEVDRGNAKEVKEIARDVQQNLEKILHHGKRADAIVKGMLQHSRSSSGQKEATDINALCDEYLRLAYHGLRAKDNSFNASFQTEFDPNIGNISIVPQDIGRVLFNLINNAFYAVSEKAKTALAAYEPVVTVTTKKLGSQIEISVSDNGNGIPDNIREKIFQPFFTTKPTGQGTGLGLSLSYDIVKAHGGELKVETKEGEGTTFIIQLPAV